MSLLLHEIVRLAAAVAALYSLTKQGAACVIEENRRNARVPVWVGRVISRTCKCDYVNDTLQPHWTMNGQRYSSFSDDRVAISSRSIAGNRLIQTQINMTVDENNADRLCCEMEGQPSACVQLLLQAQAGRRIHTSISIDCRYSGNVSWNLAVDCIVTANVRTDRDNAFFTIVIGNISESYPYYNTRSSKDWSEARDGVNTWIRQTHFPNVFITGTIPVEVGCLLERSGQNEYGQTAIQLFDPHVGTPTLPTTQQYQHVTSTVAIAPLNSDPSLSSTSQVEDDGVSKRNIITIAVVGPALLVLAAISFGLWKTKYSDLHNTQARKSGAGDEEFNEVSEDHQEDKGRERNKQSEDPMTDPSILPSRGSGETPSKTKAELHVCLRKQWIPGSAQCASDEQRRDEHSDYTEGMEDRKLVMEQREYHSSSTDDSPGGESVSHPVHSFTSDKAVCRHESQQAGQLKQISQQLVAIQDELVNLSSKKDPSGVCPPSNVQESTETDA